MKHGIKKGDVYGGRTVEDGPFQLYRKNGEKGGFCWKVRCPLCGIAIKMAANKIIKNIPCACQTPRRHKESGHKFRFGWTVSRCGERTRQRGEG